MIQLILAAIFFLGLHFGVAGTALRIRLIEKLGAKRYHAGFGVLSLLGLIWLLHAYRAADYVETWGQLVWFKPVAAALMLAAFLFVVLGLLSRDAIRPAEAEPAVGIQRVTRHPVLCGLGLWAATHVLANGDLAALILFGSLLGLVVGGGRSVAAKRRGQLGKHWPAYAAATAAMPFQAIRQGRNRLVWKEIKGWQTILALILFVAVMHFHGFLFGVSPQM